jgi:hypothetical protein
MIALFLVMFCFGFAGTHIMVVSLQSIIVEFFSLQSYREVPLALVLACPEMRAWIVTGSIQVCLIFPSKDYTLDLLRFFFLFSCSGFFFSFSLSFDVPLVCSSTKPLVVLFC